MTSYLDVPPKIVFCPLFAISEVLFKLLDPALENGFSLKGGFDFVFEAGEPL
jgi:hypothetical protein